MSLRGRKRFTADINAMVQASARGYGVHGLYIRGFKSVDEDGAFECAVHKSDEAHFISLNFVISDTSDYPTAHTFFCCSHEQGHTAVVQNAIQTIHEDEPRTIADMLDRLLTVFSRNIDLTSRTSEDAGPHTNDTSGEEDADEDEDEDMFAFDEMSDEDFGHATDYHNNIDISALRHDFTDVAAYGYRPGFSRLGLAEFIVTVSVPIIALSESIPPRAMMAWDRRLLSRPQHLTLLIYGLQGVYPILGEGGVLLKEAATQNVQPRFKVGLTLRYKPKKEHGAELVRNTTWKPRKLPSEVKLFSERFDSPEHEETHDDDTETDHAGDDEHFQSFSLSSPLESLLNHHFMTLLQLRLKHGLGWAGAEVLCWEANKLQKKPVDIVRSMRGRISEAEKEDAQLAESYALPPDPLLQYSGGDPLNLPLLVFCYLLRRLTLYPRYCLVCHGKLDVDYETLKPYVCDSKLCTYQYYNLNFGPSLEDDVCANTEMVDLLVSLTYVAAAEGVLSDPLPIGMGIRLKPRQAISGVQTDADGMCDFDTLPREKMSYAILSLIDPLPAISEMKKFIQNNRRIGRMTVSLKEMDEKIPTASWQILRWCVASCTASIEELHLEEDRLKNIDSTWRQFRFSIGAPDAENKFKAALEYAQGKNGRAKQYPSLYAFHGSDVKNWHSIIRHGLWFKEVANGRAYGHGVYFSKEGALSMGTYARPTAACWINSAIRPTRCTAVAEIVNLPSEFVCTNPYFVVNQTEWILCRYLLVNSPSTAAAQIRSDDAEAEEIPCVRVDPDYPMLLNSMHVTIPEPSYKLQKTLVARKAEHMEEDYDDEDQEIFGIHTADDTNMSSVDNAADEWIHDAQWVDATTKDLMPPPTEASPLATAALQRELKTMLTEQEKAKSLRELGWFMPSEFIGDNLFQWIVELHSFEPELPIAKDMQERGVNSLVFEIRFPPSFPHSPPFFRILKPRFLPFIHGGGGHVTGGGSMCMDLLTADGWLPSYSIPAILLQIRLAISNLEPRPARLAPNWDTPYSMAEALEGFKRAAATHGWKIPFGLERMAR